MPVLRLATFIMVRDAIRRGTRAGLLPLSLALPDMSNGALRCWDIVEDRAVQLWALHASRRLASRKVSAFLDHLRNAFSESTSDELKALMTA